MYALTNNARRARKLAHISSRRAYWPALRQKVFPAIEHESLFEAFAFDTILDVGANVGQFAIVAAALAPGARIHSFEPIGSCYERLEAIGRAYPAITPHNYALGASSGMTEINVSAYVGSSSILAFAEAQERIYPGTSVARREQIQVHTLAEIADALPVEGRTLLKLDVQGFELEVLKGAEPVLSRVGHVYLEGSFVELYEGQALAGEIVAWLAQRGLCLRSVANIDTGADRLPAQADFLFARATPAA